MARLIVWSLLVPTCLGFVSTAPQRTGATARGTALSSAAASVAARRWGAAAAPRAFSSIVARRMAEYDGPNVEDIYAEADAVFAMIDLDGNGSIEEDELRGHLLQARRPVLIYPRLSYQWWGGRGHNSAWRGASRGMR